MLKYKHLQDFNLYVVNHCIAMVYYVDRQQSDRNSGLESRHESQQDNLLVLKFSSFIKWDDLVHKLLGGLSGLTCTEHVRNDWSRVILTKNFLNVIVFNFYYCIKSWQRYYRWKTGYLFLLFPKDRLIEVK